MVVLVVAEVGEGRLGAARIPRTVRAEKERELRVEASAGAGAGAVADCDCGCRISKSMPASKSEVEVGVGVGVGVGGYRRRCWASYGIEASKARLCDKSTYECGVGRDGLSEDE